MKFNLSLGTFVASGGTSVALTAIAGVPFTAPAPTGYVWIAGDVTIRVQAATATGATTDVLGTITAAGVVDEVTDGDFADAVDEAGAIAPATVQVTVIGAEAAMIFPALAEFVPEPLFANGDFSTGALSPFSAPNNPGGVNVVGNAVVMDSAGPEFTRLLSPLVDVSPEGSPYIITMTASSTVTLGLRYDGASPAAVATFAGGATGSGEITRTITVTEAGQLRWAVTLSDGSSATVDDIVITPNGGLPNTTPPVLSAPDLTPGESISWTLGDWTPAETVFTSRLLRDVVDVGAVTSPYTLTDDDGGADISIVVRARVPGGGTVDTVLGPVSVAQWTTLQAWTSTPASVQNSNYEDATTGAIARSNPWNMQAPPEATMITEYQALGSRRRLVTEMRDANGSVNGALPYGAPFICWGRHFFEQSAVNPFGSVGLNSATEITEFKGSARFQVLDGTTTPFAAWPAIQLYGFLPDNPNAELPQWSANLDVDIQIRFVNSQDDFQGTVTATPVINGKTWSLVPKDNFTKARMYQYMSVVGEDVYELTDFDLRPFISDALARYNTDKGTSATALIIPAFQVWTELLNGVLSRTALSRAGFRLNGTDYGEFS